MTGSYSPHETSCFLTDRYELTMVNAAIHSGNHMTECIFEAFARTLPSGRRFGVVAGTGRLLELISQFRFAEAEIEWLRENQVVSGACLDWLADYRFRGTIWGYREGELYFANSPVFVVEAPFAEAVLLETLVLSVLNYDTAVASAAARMVAASNGRPLSEMGSRRANERAAVAGARAAYIAGFAATSNLEAGRRWGVPTMGTAAHAFTLLYETEEDAFRTQVEAQGQATTLLVDTFEVGPAVDAAVRTGTTDLGAVRIDSGDPAVQSAAVRRQLDSLGAVNTRITVTGDLDEYAVAALATSPVDSYGVGTAVATGSGAPTAGMVYKIVARKNADGDWIPVAKTSTAKQTTGGRKRPVRRHDSHGVAHEEVIYIDRNPEDENASRQERPLLVRLVRNGEIDQQYLGKSGTASAREHRAFAVSELPEHALGLTPGEPALPTNYA